jgi:hypothetical protein
MQPFFVDDAQAVGADAKADPTILLYVVELLPKQVHIEGPFGPPFRMRNIVANHGLLSGNLTNLRHFYLIF